MDGGILMGARSSKISWVVVVNTRDLEASLVDWCDPIPHVKQMEFEMDELPSRCRSAGHATRQVSGEVGEADPGRSPDVIRKMWRKEWDVPRTNTMKMCLAAIQHVTGEA